MVPRAGGAAPRNTGPVGTAGPRRRHTPSRSTSSGGAGVQGGMGSGAGMLRFYTDDAPGLRITPVVVLVMSLCFIGFVTILHVIGKIYTVRA
eukprot:CAMPEP_0114307982 /NCGR_PEP_ID=MMETSP0059-20121206/17795_1 /TAXON_ID=36894 /ORGANISM="Pyramimonas parkeae, Strain CCMP726" /LENGTH=91 /DNA_ID=CAMNT_0001431553 /DNA_START=185 /DNA_END=460 /DNA_ORIENTATION=-